MSTTRASPTTSTAKTDGLEHSPDVPLDAIGTGDGPDALRVRRSSFDATAALSPCSGATGAGQVAGDRALGGRRFLLSLAIVGASVCLALGISLPIIKLTKFVFCTNEHSLISTVNALIRSGQTSSASRC